MAGEIFVVDDEELMRDTITLILSGKGYDVSAFSDGETFLATVRARRPACILLDVRMPRRSGLDILKELDGEKCDVPIIMISGRGDIPTAVEAIRSGAFDFVEKPFDADTLIVRVREAIAASAKRGTSEIASEFRDVLTPRECDVLEQVVSGASTQQAARQLGISHRTIEVHRGRILEKLGAKNPADLVRIVLKRSKGS
jgi:two-component system, LuxR family, response regulator FixJ